MSETAIQYLKTNHINISQDKIKELFKDRETNKNKIARSQFAMVFRLAKNAQFINKSKELDELISDGLMGLNQAINMYDVTKGCDFAAYAFTTIKHSLYEYRLDNTFIKASTKERRNQLRDDDERAPIATRIESFKASESFNFLEVYESTQEEYVEFNYEELCRVIKEVLKPTYAEIIIAAYGLCGRNDKVTMEMVGEMFNTTKQASNQKKHNALNKLKNSPIFLQYIKELSE
jgi:RNA polymerase sigma factor (sigma-70 family)